MEGQPPEPKSAPAAPCDLEGKEYVVKDGDVMHIRHSG